MFSCWLEDSFSQWNGNLLKRANLIEEFSFQNKINTIIFDLDFTLFDSSDIVLDSNKIKIKKLGLTQ